MKSLIGRNRAKPSFPSDVNTEALCMSTDQFAVAAGNSLSVG